MKFSSLLSNAALPLIVVGLLHPTAQAGGLQPPKVTVLKSSANVTSGPIFVASKAAGNGGGGNIISSNGCSLETIAANLDAARNTIKHVVVIMQENRSFVHYFGTFPGADGLAMAGGVPVCVQQILGRARSASLHGTRKRIRTRAAGTVRYNPRSRSPMEL